MPCRVGRIQTPARTLRAILFIHSWGGFIVHVLRTSYSEYMAEAVDWSHRVHYILAKHAVHSVMATEAVNDPMAAWFAPDPASRSGRSVRVIGYSETAGAILTVILVPREGPNDWWGANA